MIQNCRIYNRDLHLKIFGEMVKLCLAKYEMNGFKLEINSISGEIVWSKGNIDIYATPFILGNCITFHIINDYFIEMESISLKKEKDFLLEDLVSIYLNIVRKKLIEWKL